MTVMPDLKVDTSQVADMVVNANAMASKFLGGVDHLKEKLNSIQAESPKSEEAKESYLHILKQLEESVVPKVQHVAKAADEFKEDVIRIEGDDKLFADAQATKTEADRSARAKLKRS